MAGSTGDYTFDAMRSFSTMGIWPTVAFLLAVVGFGAKAGLLPLHIWLPEAHPAGAFAGLGDDERRHAQDGDLRFAARRLRPVERATLVVGHTAAYHGPRDRVVRGHLCNRAERHEAPARLFFDREHRLIFVGLGLTLVFKSFLLPNLAALTLTATLYHCLNHAFFKSLLFLSTGSVLHATGERNLGKLGGLIHHMPWVTWLALIGVLASAGLPPLNGFVSEWLLLQSFLFTSVLPHGYLNMLLPVVAGAIALIAALAGFAMVKFFGVVFLGQPREERLTHAHDANRLERIGLLWLAVGCVLLGLLPNIVIAVLDPITRMLVGSGLRYVSSNYGWWMLAPISEDRASYSPAIFLGSLALFMPLVYWAVRRQFHGRLQRVPAWDCGYPMQTKSHAGYGRRFWPADPPDLLAILPPHARASFAVRPEATLSQHRRRPNLVLALRTDHAARRARHAPRHLSAAGTHRDLSALQLCHAAYPFWS